MGSFKNESIYKNGPFCDLFVSKWSDSYKINIKKNQLIVTRIIQTDNFKTHSSEEMIQSIISKLLYSPPRCSYFRNDGRFAGSYFEMFTLLSIIIKIEMMKGEKQFHVFIFILQHLPSSQLYIVMQMQKIWVICSAFDSIY